MLMIKIYLVLFFFKGSVPSEIGFLNNLDYLDISYNFFSGKYFLLFFCVFFLYFFPVKQAYSNLLTNYYYYYYYYIGTIPNEIFNLNLTTFNYLYFNMEGK